MMKLQQIKNPKLTYKFVIPHKNKLKNSKKMYKVKFSLYLSFLNNI